MNKKLTIWTLLKNRAQECRLRNNRLGRIMLWTIIHSSTQKPTALL